MLRNGLLICCCVLLSACTGSKDYSRGEESRRPTATDNIDTRPSGSEAGKINIQLGQAYLSQGKLDMAMDKLKKGIELAPRNPDGHTVIAVLYEQLGNVAMASKHYQEARKLAPESGLTANNLGRFLCSQGQYDQADGLFAAALTDPFYRSPETALLNRGGCAMSAGKLDAASDYLRQALERNPGMPDALYQSATLAMLRKDPMRARAFMERYLGVATVSPQALAFAIEIEVALDDRRAVARYRERLIQEFPESAEAESLNRNMGSR
ncbi:MAG: type IV pilus biogenesis/stability protein PilW [Rhodanobacteraceae bacterium]|jgi:type IV pilus assembly protein PilF|nr:type IV pilus biogenesis/stability protein PilW [Rhodanobacteraceae bacterium]MBP6078919.1 type IV pilus biogenesis/stability protein PilW [Xanthomonadales bacterium]MBP7623361.1 type IV pilus biogenesis/stability protein PilW [Xanthomonadales bacterium]